MLWTLMVTRRWQILIPMIVLGALGVGGCGTQGIDLPKNTPKDVRHGADLFVQRCSGCHTLKVAGTQGSAISAKTKEYKDGPNFNVRKEKYEDVLYAIRNGGFSSGPMPQNIVV